MAHYAVVVFIDSQNVYRDARRAFFGDGAPGVRGQVKLKEYGDLLCLRLAEHVGHPCDLKQVRVYAGRPDPARDDIGAQAMDLQVNAWEATGVVVSQRPLRYPKDWPTTPAQQKGVDVQLAIDLVQLYLNGFYEIGIVASTDTDLRPAAELVMNEVKAGAPVPIVTCSWNSPTFKKRLWLLSRPLWCIFLQKTDYDAIEDPTKYAPVKSAAGGA